MSMQEQFDEWLLSQPTTPTVIWKYTLPVDDVVVLELPAGSQVLSRLQAVDERTLNFWAAVNPEAPLVSKRFFVVGTGNPLPRPKPLVPLRWMDSVPAGRFIWHVFEEE